MYGKAMAAGATVVVVLILVKDGHLGKIFSDAAKGASDIAEGIKPITGIA